VKSAKEETAETILFGHADESHYFRLLSILFSSSGMIFPIKTKETLRIDWIVINSMGEDWTTDCMVVEQPDSDRFIFRHSTSSAGYENCNTIDPTCSNQHNEN
jgi:hypothetical protein